ncbi:MAG TPA: arsenate reductase family protein [Flavobacteriaceae bacterium]|nr:arsenate reductase family protein [Flavobacteriaceae bacterium]HEX5743218.1 arsenate reductase family protein [Flavobacteriaceae bacterium]
MNYKIYHNPRCSKSREGLAILSTFTDDFEIVDYLNNPPNIEEIKDLLSKLAIKPIELVRTNEVIWKENFKGKTLNDQEIIEALSLYPKLIERPIIIRGNEAIIGRPLQNINKFLR